MLVLLRKHKLNSIFGGRLQRLQLLLLMLLGGGIGLVAQPSDCGCMDNINVSLDNNCQFELQVDNVQAGVCLGDTYVIVNDSDPSNGGLIDCPGEFSYGIFRDETLVCWGMVTAEDKRGPIPIDTITVQETLECYLVDRLLNNPATIDPDDKYYLGEILFQDNCSDCGCLISRTFSDQLFYKSCDETVRSGVYAELVRTWTALDCRGHRAEANQVFTFVRPLLDTLHLVADTIYQTCTPEDAVLLTRYPYWIDHFGDRVYLDEMDCNYAVSIEQTEFPVCSNGAYKQENYVRVFDWCAGSAQYVDTFLIKVGDFVGARFTGNARNIESEQVLQNLRTQVDRDSLLRLLEAEQINSIPTGPIDCSAALSLQQQSLKYLLGFGMEDCSMPKINIQLFSYEPGLLYGFPIGDSVWVETNYSRFLEVISGIPVGIHALVMTAEDDCRNVSTGVVFFMVEDRIAPIMKCTDELNVSLTTAHPDAFDNEAYARLDAVDVNEGSVDNCRLDQLKIRRSVVDLEACVAFFIQKGYDANQDGRINLDDWFDENQNGVFDPTTEYKWTFKDGTWFTPWRDFVEFSCCDVDQEIAIELGGWDAARHPLTGILKRNLNYCWQTTVIEDNTLPALTPLPSQFIACTDPLLNRLKSGPLTGDLLAAVRAAFGETVSYGIFCGTMKVTEEIIDQRDQCGFGKLERKIEVEKVTSRKGVKVATIIQDIFIREVYDYSLCFPADVSYNCIDGPDNIPGVLTESAGCDLFATNITDDPFEAVGDPDACYKIFRTYRIVNWCEYDGFSEPVIVGRDWDDWNGCDEVPDDDPAEEEYNINPLRPDGDGRPGDEGICVIVQRDFSDDKRDVVYYDRNNDPFDQIPDDETTLNTKEGYWWKVLSGATNPNSAAYKTGGYLCSDTGVWDNDKNSNGSADDDDYQYGSKGFWQYTQHIKVIDSIAPEVAIISADTFKTINNFDCEANFRLLIDAADNCTNNLQYKAYLDFDNDGLGLRDISIWLTDTLLSGQLPIGTHRIVIEVRDVCGNLAKAEQVLTIVDDLAPTPICLAGIIVELMPKVDGGGSAAVWATDFIASPIGDCTGQGPELVLLGSGIQQAMVKDYSINRIGTPTFRDSSGVYLTCDDLGELVSVEVHAWDGAGNHDFCTTFIEVQDNQGFCGTGGNGAIAGAVLTEQDQKIEGVEIELSGARLQRKQSDVSGTFIFSNLAEGYDYTLIPKMREDAKNGVSTFDLVLMSRHVLGTKLLDSPYKLIAADVNRSGSITTLDLIQLRKLVLNIDTDFSTNTSWRFIDADYQFPDPNNPWLEAFPEVKNINNLAGIPDVNFIGIKIGDVNYSAKMNSMQDPEVRSIEGKLEIQTQDLALEAGQEYLIYLTANLEEVSGFQFTLEADPSHLELLDLSPALLKESSFGWFQNVGKLTSSYWLETSLDESAQLFGLRLKAKKTGLLSENLRLSSAYTPSEAYDAEGAKKEVALRFSGQPLATDKNQLQQNFPNPFRENTTIGFYLTEASAAEIQIQDLQGRILKKMNGNFAKGHHQVYLDKQDLPQAGWYNYQIKTAVFTESKSFLFIN